MLGLPNDERPRDSKRMRKSKTCIILQSKQSFTISIALGHTNVAYLCTRRDYREINDLTSSWPYKIKSFTTDFELI